MKVPASNVPSALSIRVLAPIVLAVPVVIVSLVLGAVAVTQSQRAAHDLAGQIVDQIDARVRQRIGDLAQTAARASRQSEHLLRLGVLDPDDLRAWLPTLREQLAIFDGVSGIVWADREGRNVSLIRYPDEDLPELSLKADPADPLMSFYLVHADGSIDPEPRARAPFNPHERPWYVAGAAALGDDPPCAWTDAYAWVRGGSSPTLGISYARAVADDSGALLGVLDTELELRSISHFLGSMRIAQTGWAFIIDRSGGLIATSIEQPIASAEGAQIRADKAADQRTRAGAVAAINETGAFAGVRAPVRTISGIDGERAWVGVSPIDAPSGPDWLLVTVVPERDLFARVKQARRHARLAGATAVIATLLAGVGVAWMAVRPILDLRDHVRKVGEGDLDREIHLTSAAELADLSRDINTMTHGLLDRARLRESLRLAMDVQQALLPRQPPKVAGLDIAGFSRYCDETGGDYFDFLVLGEAGRGQVEVALGDVMGHGVASALLMAGARAVLRSRWAEQERLSDLLGYVNRQLVPDTGGVRFMTMLVMNIDGPRARLRWSTAGQQCGLLYDAAARAFADLEGAGLPLGLDEGAAYDDHSRESVAPGSVLLLTTDGLFEARNAEKLQYGWERIRQSLLRHLDGNAQQIAEALYADLLAFCADTKPEDDVTFVVIKFTDA